MKFRLVAAVLIAGLGTVHTWGQSPSVTTGGINLKVDCSHKAEGKLPSINAALKLLVQSASNTVTVSGTCNENVTIQGFDRLTLISTSGATINDASGGQNPVLDIEDSRRVTLQGFTVNGGLDGIICANASVCYLTSNTIQSSLGQEGIAVSSGSKAFLTNNTVRNNGTRGLTVNQGSQVFSTTDSFEGNSDTGVVANTSAFFTCSNSSIANNGNGGILITDHSALRLISCSASANAGNGVIVQRGSEARFDSYSGAATVTSNSGSGVLVRDLALVFFSPGANITGNLGAADVSCGPVFSATRGFANLTGSTTNCPAELPPTP